MRGIVIDPSNDGRLRHNREAGKSMGRHYTRSPLEPMTTVFPNVTQLEWDLWVALAKAEWPEDGNWLSANDFLPGNRRKWENHMQALRRAGILVSKKGPLGGYRLARPPHKIKLVELIEAIDRPALVAAGYVGGLVGKIIGSLTLAHVVKP